MKGENQEKNETLGKGARKSKRYAYALILIVILTFLTPVIQQYQFRKSTEVTFPSLEELQIDETRMNELKAEYAKAQETLQKDSYNLDANLEKAGILSFLEEYDKSLSIYKKMADMYPNDSRPLKGWADICFTRRQYEEAKELYLQAINIDPLNVDVYVQMARLYEYLEADNEEKDKFYQESIKKLGDNQDRLLSYYAKYLEGIGEYGKAIEQWRILLLKNPQDIKIIENIERLDSLKSNLAADQAAPAAEAATAAPGA